MATRSSIPWSPCASVDCAGVAVTLSSTSASHVSRLSILSDALLPSSTVVGAPSCSVRHACSAAIVSAQLAAVSFAAAAAELAVSNLFAASSDHGANFASSPCTAPALACSVPAPAVVLSSTSASHVSKLSTRSVKSTTGPSSPADDLILAIASATRVSNSFSLSPRSPPNAPTLSSTSASHVSRLSIRSAAALVDSSCVPVRLASFVSSSVDRAACVATNSSNAACIAASAPPSPSPVVPPAEVILSSTSASQVSRLVMRSSTPSPPAGVAGAASPAAVTLSSTSASQVSRFSIRSFVSAPESGLGLAPPTFCSISATHSSRESTRAETSSIARLGRHNQYTHAESTHAGTRTFLVSNLSQLPPPSCEIDFKPPSCHPQWCRHSPLRTHLPSPVSFS